MRWLRSSGGRMIGEGRGLKVDRSVFTTIVLRSVVGSDTSLREVRETAGKHLSLYKRTAANVFIQNNAYSHVSVIYQH